MNSDTYAHYVVPIGFNIAQEMWRNKINALAGALTYTIEKRFLFCKREEVVVSQRVIDEVENTFGVYYSKYSFAGPTIYCTNQGDYIRQLEVEDGEELLIDVHRRKTIEEFMKKEWGE